MIHKKKQKKHNHRNLKQIFILSFDALRERKARSSLTILMVVVGSALMVALNGLSAGAADFISKQLNFLAPNVIFVSPGQIGFRGGPSAPPTIVFNAEVVNRIKSLPFVQDVVPAYQGQLQLDAQGNIINSQVLATDPTKIYLIAPSMQLIPGSSIQANNPIGMLVGDSVANPPGKTTPFVTVGQTVKATSTFVNPNTGRTEQTSRSFVVTGVMQPTGNGQVDKVVFINAATGNSLFKKSGKYDEMVVLALSGTYVNAVQQEITNLYGSNNIGVITPKAIMQAQAHTQSVKNLLLYNFYSPTTKWTIFYLIISNHYIVFSTYSHHASFMSKWARGSQNAVSYHIPHARATSLYHVLHVIHNCL